ncbi:hypothetical protein [Alteromonas sp. H39]|uniref:hypothetical protein n=1 Tax=Alteromonas sp. H39 TaxID=3389876 RepID=UPI0039E1E6D0
MTAVFPQLPTAIAFYFVALLLHVLTVRRLTAFSFVIVGVLLLDFLHVGFEFFLKSHFHEPAFSTLVYYSWYLGFALSDFAFVAVIATICKNANLKLDIASKVILSLYVVLGAIQLFSLVERLVVNSKFAYYFYTQSIPILNFIIAVTLFGFIAISLFSGLRQQKTI